MGSTTFERSTGALGTTPKLCTRFRALSKCHRPANSRIPAAGLLAFRPRRARPCLYSDKEIEQLLRATLNLPLSPRHCKRCALLPWVYYCLFGLLSVAGLRLSEARNLELRDVDLKTAVLTIRRAKFGKDRLVPLHASTCRVLAAYIARRQRHWAERPVSSYLFVSSWGNRLDVGQIHRFTGHSMLCPDGSAYEAPVTDRVSRSSS